MGLGLIGGIDKCGLGHARDPSAGAGRVPAKDARVMVMVLDRACAPSLLRYGQVMSHKKTGGGQAAHPATKGNGTMAHIIVVGNEKGGAGKATVSMHVATALARMGHKTSALDLDLRQRTFGRYAYNRAAFLKKSGLDLPGPRYHDL